ncbi:GGDEF domain-containing protein [Marinomonas sp.]|nr:GGDEF domain-containing protein [Marinomonas sp.]MDB4838120.1 GGDEF domain-containing protein [Marinomonas sp.]
MTHFMRDLLRKIGRPRLVILFVVIASLLSIFIKYLLEKLFGFSFILFEEVIFILIAVSLIAPLLSWYLLGLLFELDELEIQLTKLATIDALTNTYNRGHFYSQSRAYIDQFFVQFERRDSDHVDSKVVIMIIDLDDFKSINDVFGHSVGDDVLVAFSSVLMNTIQVPNIVGRFGGDEFVALLVDTNEADLKRLLEELIANVRAHTLENNGRPCSFTSSIGAAFIDNKNVTLDEALIKADEALYDVKRKGKNGYAIYNSRLQQ